MQKKLKLIVMALCLASPALAQEPDTIQVAAGEQNEEAFTFTEAQLGEDDDMSQNVTIISSNQNLFASSAGFQFSAVRFRYRAFNQRYNEIFINGAPMNDLESGQFRFSLIGGLNRYTNNSRETSLPFEFNNFSMPGMAGSNNYDLRPSRMATGQYASLAGANRNYTVRAMYTYNTGLRPDGWAFSAGVTYRWASPKTAYIKGTFYNSLSYFLGAEKKLNDKHSIALVTWGNPTERANQGAATDESYWLANSNYYNPYWGYQDGKIRNSRVVKDFAPTVLVNWNWDISQKLKLTTAMTGRYSMYKGTKLNYNSGENPAPDYWKRLPSSFFDVWYDNDPGNTRDGYAAWDYSRAYLMGSERNRQIDWDALYYANQQANRDGRDALYYVEAKHINTFNLTLASTLKAELSKSTSANIGLSLATNTGQHYWTMEDLLGANTFHNLNTYAMSYYSPNDPRTLYDINDNGGEVKEGDRFGGDYNLIVRKAQLWGTIKYKRNRMALFGAARVSGVTMQRDGKMRNGIIESLGMSSYGKSGTAKFLDGGVKGGLTYNIGSGHVISLGAGYELKAPQPQNAFQSPVYSNEFVAHLKNEKIFSSEACYMFSAPWMKANINGYYSYMTDVTEWQNYFDDDINSFSYVSMTGIKKVYYGLEWGISFKVSPSFSIKTLGAIGEAKNTNNSKVTYMSSTKGDYYEEAVLNKNMREAGTPLSVYGLTLSYRSGGWFIDLSGNYYDRIYLSYSPSYRYESTLKNRNEAAITRGIDAERTFDDDGNLIQSAVAQTKGKGGFMLDASIGRSIRLKHGQLSINLQLTNLLNNTKMVTGGYEQGRSNYSINTTTDEISTTRLYRFDRNPKKYYAYGFNGMLNIGYRF
jgi:hypothetical protein